mmetsp:Transcript_18441/g.27860  ORF Transcript_18441/g.27860 Transcript_18441/m.27860 type:complete len:223 (-) Transcript_18441:411-1079(-)
MTELETNKPSVLVVPKEEELPSLGIIRVKLPDKLDCRKWATELSKVTPQIMAFEGDGEYALYRNIYEDPNFPFQCILDDESSPIRAAILRYFKIQDLSEIRMDDAFCVHYNMSQYDTSGAKHLDPSDITVNMCLEKCENVEGSEVLFYGTQPLEGVQQKIDKSFQFAVEQIPGYATIHWGVHPHETLSLKQGGKRTNIIITYCYTDSSRSDVASRSCYHTNN